MDGFKRPGNQSPSPVPPDHMLPRPVTADEPLLAEHASPDRVTNTQQYSDSQSTELTKLAPKPKKRRSFGVRVLQALAVLFGFLLVLAAGVFVWYQQSIGARSSQQDETFLDVTIEQGTTVNTIATTLEDNQIIKDKFAFIAYTRLNDKATAIKEGTCRVKSSQSVSDIVDMITQGCYDFKKITFFPGATIEKPLYAPDYAQLDQTMFIKYRLTDAGYSTAEIEAAFAATYTGPLFEGRPVGAGLEGYVYGETYHVATDATVTEVLQTTFDQMYKDIQKYQLSQKYAEQNLTMFEAITMASIVQRELNCEGKPTAERTERCYQYQRTIAQVFLKRLREGISLGSDVTFIYAADMMGIAPSVSLESPYNTRIYTGLPPGPIASPGLLALRAVADPSDTEYLFFIAGDDGLIYFAKDQAGHEANIRDHCQIGCGEL
ncbi:endolytic transglycosylase MltG [Candidatus Saccharibacteria bacterium]|nr:endolytic transglycosylase MltG [Candidatus Saccharibacteria bacterium]